MSITFSSSSPARLRLQPTDVMEYMLKVKFRERSSGYKGKEEPVLWLLARVLCVKHKELVSEQVSEVNLAFPK